jgi:hypothetical protein
MAVDLTPNARYDRSSTGITPPFTWCSWVRPDAIPSPAQDYVCLTYLGSVSYNDHVALFLRNADSRISLWDDTFTERAGVTQAVTTGTWLFVAFTVDGSGNVAVYWRTENQTSLSSDIGTVSTPIDDDFLYIGSDRNAPGFTHTLDGAFAYTRVFDSRVLPVGVLMDESMSPVALEPVGSDGGDWPFTTTAGTDVSGQDNDLFFDTGTGSASVTSDPDIDPFPALLPSQVGQIQKSVQFAWAADLSADPRTWTWTDATADLLERQTVSVKFGRADESSQAQPASTSFTLDNPNSDYTPGHPLGTHYPNVSQEDGIPCRLGFYAGSPHLAINGSSGARARTPDHADLDITGDLYGKIDVTVPHWPLPAGFSGKIVGKYASANRSWQPYLIGDRIGFMWSTDGAASGELSAETTIPLWMPSSNRLVIAWHIDVNNGSGGRTIRFWTARRWSDPLRLHEAITQSGTTSIFSGTAPLDIGDIAGSGFVRSVMEVHRFELRAGDATGELRATPNFAGQTAGATSFQDSTGRTWSIDGTATLTNLQTRISGQVDEISPRWPYGDLSDPDNPDETPGEARASFTVSGPLRRMSQGDKPLQSSLYRLATARHNIDHVLGYWPCEDGSEARQIATPIPGAKPMGFGGDIQFAADDTLSGSKPLMSVSGGQGAGWATQVPLRAGITNWAAEFFVKIPTRETNPASTVLGFVDTTGTVRSWRLAVSDTNFRVIGTNASEVDIVDSSFSAAGFTTNWTLIRLEAALGGGGTVDWEVSFAEVGSGIASGTGGSYSGFAGRPNRFRQLDIAPPDGWSFGHLLFTTDLAAGWLAPADLGWPGETAADRIARLCREERVPVSIWGDRDTSEPMGPQKADSLVNLLQECADADMGILGEQRTQLALHYRCRSTLYNQTPAFELDAATNDITPPFEPTSDDQRRRNDITATRRDGSSERVVDADVEAGSKPRYDTEDTLNVWLDGQLAPQAGWRFHLGTWPGMRYPSLTTELTVAPHRIDEWLTAVPGDRATVANLPPQHPPGPVDVLLEQIQDDVTPERWEIAGVCSPGGPWTVAVLEDPELGRLDTASSELATGIDDDDTSLSIATTAGPLWITSASFAAMFPFDVTLGGEAVTVTAISGGSSPQTFTVTRRVNGVRKSHLAGTALSLTAPMRVAL